MCEFFSGIVKRDLTVLSDLNSNSHEDMINKFGLDDTLSLNSRDWVRFEFTPKDLFSLKKGDWSFKVDEDSRPKWCKTAHKLACWSYLKKNVLDMPWFMNARLEVERVKKIIWFKPMVEPDLQFLEEKAVLIQKAFKLKGRRKVKIRLIRLNDSAAWSAAESAARSAAWSAARSAAWSADWSAADSAADSAARSAARSAAWSAARSAARSADWSAARSAAWSADWSADWSAADSAADSAAESAARSAAFEVSADVNKKYTSNPSKHYVDLWEMGYYCCGLYNNTLTLGYILKNTEKK